ncbi:hypothetical protein MSAN_02323600 [Mycena sanguinolenta]|uniref:Uncharacterized protein n=1 Tax=Mycena sanguinolenta TaxID=230812 RepID=A0A8H6X799_9AGAR|nr:hypothetical protein MSAN_02323600 [Mycena sanguinolenta]
MACTTSPAEDASYMVAVADLEPFNDTSLTIRKEGILPVPMSKAMKAEMRTGEGYRGMEVLVAHQHPRKGVFGTVDGYAARKIRAQPYDTPEFKTDSRGRLRWMERKREREIVLIIQVDMTAEKFEATMDQVVNRFSRLPLWKHRMLEAIGGIEPEHRPAEEPRERTPCPEEPLRSGLALARTLQPPLAERTEETTGEWLMCRGFVGKRVDVRVEGVERSNYRKAATKSAMKREGSTGFLEPPAGTAETSDVLPGGCISGGGAHARERVHTC